MREREMEKIIYRFVSVHFDSIRIPKRNDHLGVKARRPFSFNFKTDSCSQLIVGEANFILILEKKAF